MEASGEYWWRYHHLSGSGCFQNTNPTRSTVGQTYRPDIHRKAPVQAIEMHHQAVSSGVNETSNLSLSPDAGDPWKRSRSPFCHHLSMFSGEAPLSQQGVAGDPHFPGLVQWTGHTKSDIPFVCVCVSTTAAACSSRHLRPASNVRTMSQRSKRYQQNIAQQPCQTYSIQANHVWFLDFFDKLIDIFANITYDMFIMFVIRWLCFFHTCLIVSTLVVVLSHAQSLGFQPQLMERCEYAKTMGCDKDAKSQNGVNLSLGLGRLQSIKGY